VGAADVVARRDRVGMMVGFVRVDAVCTVGAAGALFFDFIHNNTPMTMAITSTAAMAIGTIGDFFSGVAGAVVAAGMNDDGMATGGATTGAAIGAIAAGFTSTNGSGSCNAIGSFVARRCM